MKLLVLATTLCLCAFAAADVRIYSAEITPCALEVWKKDGEKFIKTVQEKTWNANIPRLEQRYGITIGNILNWPLQPGLVQELAGSLRVEFEHKDGIIAAPTHINVYASHPQDVSKMSYQDKMDYLRAIYEVFYDALKKEYHNVYA